MEAHGDAPGSTSLGTRLDGETHGPRHRHRVVGTIDGRCHQDPVTAQLHGQGGVRCRADTGVEDHRDVDSLPEEGDVVGVTDAQPAADRRPRGMTAAQPTCCSRKARTGSSVV